MKKKISKKSRSYSVNTKRRLYGGSANYCAMPNCNTYLYETDNEKTGEKTYIGEIAHIRGVGKEGPRADPNYPQDKIDSEENLIVVCRNCHKIIDSDPRKYTIENIEEIKRDHEKIASDAFNKAKINCELLNVVVKDISERIKNTIDKKEPDFKLTEIKEKIYINKLSKENEDIIVDLLEYTHIIKDYFDEVNKYTKYFIEEFKNKFITIYTRYAECSTDQNDVFDRMITFVMTNRKHFSEIRAAQAILVYFFELCEIFKK